MSLKNIINPFTGLLQKVVNELSLNTITFKDGVADFASLPSSGNSTNDGRFTNDDGHLYIWNGSSWVDQGDVINVDWGVIGGTLSNQTDLQSALDAKLSSVSWGDIIGTLSGQTDLQSALDVKTDKLSTLSPNTKLLLHLDGTDGQTTTTDATGRHTGITFGGSAELDTAFQKFGTASLLVPRVVSSSIDVPIHADWDGLFDSVSTNRTIDFFIKHDDSTTTTRNYFIVSDGTSDNIFNIASNTNGINVFWKIDSVTIVSFTATQTITDTNWHHVAVCKVGNEYGIYLDGVIIKYFTNNTLKSSWAGPFRVGRSLGTTEYAKGSIDEFRVMYNNDFLASPDSGLLDTITVPTTAHTADSVVDDQISIVKTTGLTERSGVTLATLKESAIEYAIDGGGAVITTGIAGQIEVPFDFTISEVTVIGDQSGSIVVDINKSTYAGFPTTSSIIGSGGTLPTLSSAQKSQDSSLSNWTTSFTKGDILEYVVDSVTTLERCLISFKGTRT